MKSLMLALCGLLISCTSAISASDSAALAQGDSKFYLFYNLYSPVLESELGMSRGEAQMVFDDQFGLAAEKLPLDVKPNDFYIAKYPDQSYVFILDAKFNCAQEGCATERYTRDQDGDLYYEDYSFPVKCKAYEPDKLLCIKGGYQPEKSLVAVGQLPKKKIIHYLAPSHVIIPQG